MEPPHVVSYGQKAFDRIGNGKRSFGLEADRKLAPRHRRFTGYLSVMGATALFPGLELDLDAIQDQLTPEAARVILALKSSPTAQVHHEDLATRCREGQLRDTERLELDQIAKLNTLVGLLKVRAHGVLHPVR